MAPGRTSAPADEMKMWNISVAPMPSSISMPEAGWSRVANGGADFNDLPHHAFRREGRVQETHRGACPHRKDQQPAQAEGEGQRRRADHDVVRPGAQHMALSLIHI